MGFNYLFIFPPCYVAFCASKARHRLSSESVSWCLETSLFLRLPSWAGAPSLPLLSLFLSFIFFPTSFRRQWAAFLVPDVLRQHSEVVLWNLLSIQMFFWWICGGESGLPVLFLHHLRATSNMYFLNIIIFERIVKFSKESKFSSKETSNYWHQNTKNYIRLSCEKKSQFLFCSVSNSLWPYGR